MNFESFRAKIAYQPLLLGCFALLASGALAWASSATSGAIAAAEAKDLRDSLAEVLPQGMADNDFLNDTLDLKRGDESVKIYRARHKGELKAVLFKVAERGYSGVIEVLLAVDPAGRILGVRILKHTETPGLGDKIEIRKDDWVLDFDGKSLGNPEPEQWGVKKDNGVFDQFAGATITPRAVVKAVKEGLAFFVARKGEITAQGGGNA